ncbi:MAG: choice-of-anchor R domain-containing protein [Acetobacteraceae bacterium]
MTARDGTQAASGVSVQAVSGYRIMRFPWVATAAIGAALTVLPALRARADVLMNTTGLVPSAADVIAPASAIFGGGGPIADSFSVGPQGLMLSSVNVVLGATNSADGGAMLVSLWTTNPTGSSGGLPAPGSLVANLATVNDSSLSTRFSSISIPVTQAIALAANGRYWVELSNVSSTAVTSGQWEYASATQAMTIPNAANEYNWGNYAGFANYSSTDSANGVDLFEVSAVPEPSAFILLGLGMLVLGLARIWASGRVSPASTEA